LLLGTTPLNGRNDLVDAVRDISGASATIFLGDVRIATNIKNRDGSRGIGTKLAPGPARASVLDTHTTYRGIVPILGARYLAVYEPIRDAHAQTIGILFVGVPLAEAESFARRITQQAAAGALAVILVTSLGYLWALRGATRPLRDLTEVMHRIAEGDLASAVPCMQRTDQIGRMARALLRLRDASARASALEEAARSRAEAEAQKHAALVRMVEGIESETTAAINEVAARTAGMRSTAEKMATSATRTGSAAKGAAAASSQVLATAQTVASAAEQLTASIREISHQVNQSNAIVARAVAAGSETRSTIDALNERVGRIGAVANMIGEIAAKTNLLALNATIEAARAGDAGKGFAVVASEVKALATQTARSTGEIAQHLAEVRTATGISVAAVTRIEQTIHEIDAVAGSIAAAVEEQGAATAEIARNVAETASAAQEMTSHVTAVSSEADQTGVHAEEVCTDAGTLNNAVTELRHAVIRVVRTGSAELDRRTTPRFPQDLSCQISVEGHSQPAQLHDLSEGGACIAASQEWPVGTRGNLHIDSVGFGLPFIVRSAGEGVLHVQLELDAAVAERFRGMPEQLARRHAA
jgi:methyl-accepting chemotaxis protein